jgi:hypothetical protein
MAKALLGFAATPTDPRLIAEVRALRSRVRDLEAELDRTRAENDVLAAATVVLDAHADNARREPALT